MDVTEFTISELGPKGDGIHETTEGRVFVDRAIPGDRIRGRRYPDPKGIFRAEIVEILQPSEARQTPPCPHYDVCGNCTVQHLNPEYYRTWKTGVVRDALQKQRLNPETWLPPVFIGSGNRRRLTFSAFKNRGKVVIGYYRRRTHQIVDIPSCLIAHPKLFELRGFLKLALAAILSERDRVDVSFQMAGKNVDMVLTGAIGRNGAPDTLATELLRNFSETTSIVRIGWRLTSEDEIQTLVQREPLVIDFGGVKVSLPFGAFLQPTVDGEQALVNAVMAAMPQKGKFADLFSGCGTFSGPMLSRGSVDAFEMVASAVTSLGKAARLKPLAVFRRDLYKNPLRKEEINKYDVVVFDPPRSGCPEQAMAMARARTPLLIGISCNPATFARDARILCGGGYKLKSVQIFDQFLWSHHVEVVGVFTK